MPHFDALSLLGLFAIGTAAGFVDSIAGGGGLLTLPTLLWVGLDPAQALATNKLQGSFGTASASLTFVRAGTVQPARNKLAIAATFIAAGIGSACVQRLNLDSLRTVIPFLLLAAAAFFWLAPSSNAAAPTRRLSDQTYACTVAPALGFYDGFFGPGTGSFMAFSQVTLLGKSLMAATEQAKILNLASNAASLLLFLASGNMVWSAGLAMAAGQIVGARLGARQVIRRGAALVRPLLVVVSVAIALRLLYTAGFALW